MIAAEAKLPADRAHRLRLRRHAQPHPFRDRQGVRRGRLQRHVRQAADLRPGPGRGAGQGRAEDRRRLRRDAQLHRLSAGPPGPRHGPGRRTGRDQRRPRLLHPGLAAHAGSKSEGQKQAAWRTDPKQSGAAGCFGDIGTHAYNLGRFITGLLPDQISCHLKTFEPGRRSTTTARRSSASATAALGTVTASQISHGRENDLWIEVDGTKGSLEWHQEEPNKMLRAHQRPAAPDLHARRRSLPRPDGRRPRRASRAAIPRRSWKAFANIYTAAYDDMVARAGGPEVRRRTQPLSQRRRRRGWHELHHAVRRQLRGGRGLAAAEASVVPIVKETALG